MKKNRKKKILERLYKRNKQKFSFKFSDLKEWSLKKLDTRVLCLIKVGLKEHIESLADGKIYCRHLKFYKDPQFKDEPFYDIHEGLSAVYQSSKVNLTFGDKKLDLDAKSQLVISHNHDFPAFCLHAMHTGHWTHRKFKEHEIRKMKEFLQIPSSMDKFQGHVMTIINFNVFIDRLRDACIKKGIGFDAGLVKYVDTKKVHGTVDKSKIGFIKQKSHAHEREYRVVFRANGVLDDPFVLDIGSLRDIVQIMTLEEFRKKWKLGFRK